jgi:hypothetical protein
MKEVVVDFVEDEALNLSAPVERKTKQISWIKCSLQPPFCWTVSILLLKISHCTSQIFKPETAEMDHISRRKTSGELIVLSYFV